MASSKRQRELARRRAQRQAALRAAARARRRRRNLTIGGVLAAVLLLTGAVVAWQVFVDDDATDASQAVTDPTPTPGTEVVACGAQAPPPPQKQTFAKPPPLTIDRDKSYTASIQTSCGPITAELFAAKAPQTVNSLAFLASKNFYDGTFCHRMTTGESLTVLQCGDPEGTGTGGPGYTLAEENLKGATYPRGTVAMAKSAQPHSTGSQFFLVAQDSRLPPEYTPVGRITEGLDVLDKILAIGIEGDAGDGPPKQKVYLERFTVTAA